MISKNFKLTKDEKEIINQFDSRLYGYIIKNANYHYYLKLIIKGIEHFEALLFWKKNLGLLQYDSNYELYNEAFNITENYIYLTLGNLNLLIEQYPQALSAYQRFILFEKFYWKNSNFLYGIGLVYFHFGAFDLAIDAFYQTLYVDPNFFRANEIHFRLGIIHKIRGDFKFTLKHFQLALIDETNPLSFSKGQVYFHVAHLLECFGYLTLSRQFYEIILNASKTDEPPPDGSCGDTRAIPSLKDTIVPDLDAITVEQTSTATTTASVDEYQLLENISKNATSTTYVEIDPYLKANTLRQVGWLIHNFSDIYNYDELPIESIQTPLPGNADSTETSSLFKNIDKDLLDKKPNQIIDSIQPYIGIRIPSTSSTSSTAICISNTSNTLINTPSIKLPSTLTPKSEDDFTNEHLKDVSNIKPEFNENLAIRFLQSAIHLDPTNGQTWYYLGRCFAQIGKIHDAFISYRHSIDKSEGSAETWCSIGVLYQQQNQPMDALQAYICAIQLNKKFTPAWTNLALLYETCNMPKDALTCYANAIKAGDANPALLPRIKKLKDIVLTGNFQNYYSKGKYPLPTIEEAWNLPIPAELTSRQNADSKIPPFMAKYVYPLLQQQREMKLKLGHLYSTIAQSSLNGSYRTMATDATDHNKTINNSLLSSDGSGSPTKKTRSNTEFYDKNKIAIVDNNDIPLTFDDDVDEDTLMDPAMEREMESLLALDGADTTTLIDACMMGTPLSSTGLTPNGLTPIDYPYQFNASSTNQMHSQYPTINKDNLSAITSNLNLQNKQTRIPLLGDFSTPTFLYDAASIVNPLSMQGIPTTLTNTSAVESSQNIRNNLNAKDIDTKQFDGDNLLCPQLYSSFEIANISRSEVLSDFEKALSNLDVPPPRPPTHPNPPDPFTLSSLPGGNMNSATIPTSTNECVPIVTISGKKQAHGQDLKNFCLNKPSALIKGLCQCLKLDLGLFSTKTLVRTQPEHTIEVRAQAKFPLHKNYSDPKYGRKTSWKCISTRHYMPLLKYARYQGTSFKRALEEEKAKGSAVETEENEAKAIKDVPPFKKILFGTNVDLSDEVKWVEQLQEISKLPTFLRVSSPTNMLSHIGHTVLGMNSVQLYMKVPGCRTPGHRENLNFCSVNINIGPGDTEWFTVRDEYWGALADLCSARGCDFLKGSWWPGDIEELHKYNIPFTKFTQKPGDIVWINSGTVHWVQASGWCNNIAWNVGPLNAYQYESALLHYEWNKLQQYKSLVPMVHLSWNLARNVKFNNEIRFYQLLMSSLQKSLKKVHVLEEILVTAFPSINVHFHGIAPGELTAHYCDKCEIEVFNLLFVLEASIVHCFECARRISSTLDGFVVLKQYETRELDAIFDNLKKSAPLSVFTANKTSLNACVTSPTLKSHLPNGTLENTGTTKINLNINLHESNFIGHLTHPSNTSGTSNTHKKSSSGTTRKRSSNPKSSGTTGNTQKLNLKNVGISATSNASVLTSVASNFLPSSFEATLINLTPVASGNSSNKSKNLSHIISSTFSNTDNLSNNNSLPIMNSVLSSSIPSHKLMRTPSGKWIKKD